MKYLLCATPMLLCSEIVSIACLIALTACFLADVYKEKEGRK